MMKATHTNYKHPGHLRVEDGGSHASYAGGVMFKTTAICVSPNSELHKRLNRNGLPSWQGGKIVDGVEVPL